jgi:hypothetical protein
VCGVPSRQLHEGLGEQCKAELSGCSRHGLLNPSAAILSLFFSLLLFQILIIITLRRQARNITIKIITIGKEIIELLRIPGDRKHTYRKNNSTHLQFLDTLILMKFMPRM